MVGRTLADFGATVFKVVTKKRPRRALFDEETNNGKQPLELDLADAADLARLWSLLDAADVLVDGYTEGALAKFGLDEAAAFARCPHSSSCACRDVDGPVRRAAPTFRDYAKRITRLLFKLDGRMRADGNLKYLPLALDTMGDSWEDFDDDDVKLPGAAVAPAAWDDEEEEDEIETVAAPQQSSAKRRGAPPASRIRAAADAPPREPAEVDPNMVSIKLEDPRTT
ncbi:alpha-methylacyl-CoA racemase [Aureococcus anophagefferens]|nr:alpha-methylacyl-CoA racemase [Aureococcus anophagefferens]